MSDHAHSSECEEADVGSLCDCDCAGAKHAVRRTKGGVPGAGQVSKRAQKAAQAAGKAPVVNNRAVASGRARRGPDLPAKPARPARAKPSRTAARPSRLTPTTAAKAHAVRAALPADRAGWKSAALVQDPTLNRAHARNIKRTQNRLDEAKAAQQEWTDKTAGGEYAKRLMALSKGRPGYQQYKGLNDPQLQADAKLTFPNGVYDHPDLLDEVQRHQSAVYDAQRAVEQAQRDADRDAAGSYPMDPSTGLRMPSDELKKHLAAVKDVGRAALADAKAEFTRTATAQVKDAQQLLDRQQLVREAWRNLMRRTNLGANLDEGGASFMIPGLGDEGDVRITSLAQYDQLLAKYSAEKQEFDSVAGAEKQRQARKSIAAHQATVLREILGEHRAFGGVHHDSAKPGIDQHTLNLYAKAGRKDPFGITSPRRDWQKRLNTAEDHFPADWLKVHAAGGLQVGSSRRAYMGERDAADGSKFGMLSMPSHERDSVQKDGALDEVDETNVHELGHRMEQLIPGLTHLEFAYVRERGVNADGSVQQLRPIYGYEDQNEKAQEDKWGNPYAGKSYEQGAFASNPGDQSWEVFQTGLQDTFGRSSARFGPHDDPEELQAFVIGALLTLG